MFMTESTKKINEDVRGSSTIPQNSAVSGTEETEAQETANNPDIVASSMQRPVDLYKVLPPFLYITCICFLIKFQ